MRDPGDTATDHIVELNAVSVRVPDGREAVRDVSFTVRAGELYALLGSHGSGKTTILDVVAGLIAPATGTVRVLGRTPSPESPAPKRAIVFAGHNALYGALTPVENARFFLALSGRKCRDHADAIVDALREVGVADRCLDQPLADSPRSVTIGVHLALAVLREAKLLLLDDPTLGLDSRAASALQRSIRVVRERGATVLLATSDVILAGSVADRTGVLVHGAFAVEHERDEWLDRTVVELYAEYLGRPLTDPAPDGGPKAP